MVQKIVRVSTGKFGYRNGDANQAKQKMWEKIMPGQSIISLQSQQHDEENKESVTG